MEQSLRQVGQANLDQIGAALAAAVQSNTPMGARDAAIFILVCAAGLRDREIQSLDVGDVAPTRQALRIRQSDGHERTLVLSRGASSILGRWLEVRGDEPGALFCCLRRKASAGRQRMSEAAVAASFRHWTLSTGGMPFSGGDLRKAILPARCHGGSRFCCCPWVMGFDLVPIDYPRLDTLSPIPALPPLAPAVRYLTQLDAQTRRKATTALGLLLSELGHPDADVFRYPWASLTYDRLRLALDRLPRDFAVRTRIRRSLTGVLTHSFRDGEISMVRFDELCGWSWRGGGKKENEA